MIFPHTAYYYLRMTHKRFIFPLTSSLITLVLTISAAFTSPSVASAADNPNAPTPGTAISAALAQYKSANPQAASLTISNIARNDAFVIAYLRTSAEQPDYPQINAILAVRTSDGTWQAVTPDLDAPQQYNAILASFPNEVIDEATRNFMSLPEPRQTLLAATGLSGYKLPWQAQTSAAVSQKDGSTHANQIDFLIANDGVYASKPGTVLYVKEVSPDPASPQCLNDGVTWKKGNYVVIQHSATEYSWYEHLAFNSVIVKPGDRVTYGQRIGTEGRTGFTCGTTGIHLHFMVSSWAPSVFPDPNLPNESAWPILTSITAVDFAESTWANLTVGSSYTSKNISTVTAIANLPAGAALCANENGQCNFDGIGTLYFGVPGSYYAQPNITYSAYCGTSSFGDPAPNQAKKCYVLLTSPAPACPTVTNAARFYDDPACQNALLDAPIGLKKLENTTANDRVESLALPAGWSARLYKNNTETTADSLCLAATDKNLNDNAYTSGGSLGNSITWLRVFNNSSCRLDPPAPFTKTAPAPGTVLPTTSVTLSWATSANAAGYEYCYDTSNDNACSTWVTKSGTSKTFSGLQPNTTYYWQVRAKNSTTTTYANASATAFASFTSGAGSLTLNKSLPLNNATGVSTNVTLTWQPYLSATSYQICYDTTNDNACSNWQNVGTHTATTLSGLTPNISYYWQLRATTPTGNTLADNNTSWKFTTSLSKPAKATALNATHGSLADRVRLTWQAAAGATTYQVLRAGTNVLPSSALVSGLTTLTYDDRTATPGKTYTYWVKACNTAGCSTSEPTNGFAAASAIIDLQVKAVTSGASQIIGLPISLVVKVKNVGSAPSGAFAVKIYDGSAPTACGQNGIRTLSVSGLAAGTAQEISTTITFASQSHHSLYAMADANCQISESFENNNLFGPVELTLNATP